MTLDFDNADYVDLSDVSDESAATLSDVFDALRQEKLSDQYRSLLKILEEIVGDTTVTADLKKWEDDYFPLLEDENGKKDIVETVRALYNGDKLNWKGWCRSGKITVLEADNKDSADNLLTELYGF